MSRGCGYPRNGLVTHQFAGVKAQRETTLPPGWSARVNEREGSGDDFAAAELAQNDQSGTPYRFLTCWTNPEFVGPQTSMWAGAEVVMVSSEFAVPQFRMAPRRTGAQTHVATLACIPVTVRIPRESGD